MMETGTARRRAAKAERAPCGKLRALILAHQDWLIERALAYRHHHLADHAEAAAPEEWNQWAGGVLQSIDALLVPDDASDFEDCGPGQGGQTVAQRATLPGENGRMPPLKLSEMPYWRSAVTDLVEEKTSRASQRTRLRSLVDRTFDQVEIDICRRGYPGLTEEIRSLRADRRRLSLLETAMDAAEEMVVITDSDGRIEHVNDSFVAKTGYSKEESIGQKTSLLKSGQQSRQFYRNLWKTILAGQVWEGEITNRRRNGMLYSAWMRITPILGLDGKTEHFVAINKDISERRERERRELETRLSFEKLIDIVPIPVCMTDTYGVLTFCNRKFADLVELPRDAVIGRTIEEIAPPGHAEIHMRVDEELMREGGERVYDLEFTNEQGVSRRYRSYKSCVRGNSNEVIGIVGVVGDTTPDDEIRKVRTEASAEALKKLEQMIVFLGHELHSPIASIQASAEILRNPSTPDKDRARFTEMIRSEACGMGELVSDILDVTRIASGLSDWNIGEFDLRRVLERTIKRVRHNISVSSDLRFECEIWGTSLRMEGDERLIGRMVFSLLENAFLYTPVGTVRLTADNVESEDHRRILLSFDDTGPGIPQAILDGLDQPFSLSSGLLESTRAQGTGLGLILSQSIIRLHGGSWDVTTKSNGGTRIRVYLPVFQAGCGRGE